MTNILTIIEDAPSGALKYPGTDKAIDDFVKEYSKKGAYRASSMQAVRDLLIARINAGVRIKYDRIQIIGHGAPGMQSLGWTWAGVYSKSAEGPVYLMDGNPYNYGVLSAYNLDGDPVPLVTAKEVCLVGCNIASDDPLKQELTVANGDTLIADLAQMWGCPVSAATGLVTIDALDPATGQYNGPAVVWSWMPLKRQYRAGVSLPDPDPKHTEDQVTFERLLAVPVLGALQRDFDLSIPQNSLLHTAFFQIVNLRALLALPEFIFEVTWQGVRRRANLICRQKYLQVLDGQGEILVTLAAAQNQADGLRKQLRVWLEDLPVS